MACVVPALLPLPPLLRSEDSFSSRGSCSSAATELPAAAPVRRSTERQRGRKSDRAATAAAAAVGGRPKAQPGRPRERAPRPERVGVCVPSQAKASVYNICATPLQPAVSASGEGRGAGRDLALLAFKCRHSRGDVHKVAKWLRFAAGVGTGSDAQLTAFQDEEAAANTVISLTEERECPTVLVRATEEAQKLQLYLSGARVPYVHLSVNGPPVVATSKIPFYNSTRYAQSLVVECSVPLDLDSFVIRQDSSGRRCQLGGLQARRVAARTGTFAYRVDMPAGAPFFSTFNNGPAGWQPPVRPKRTRAPRASVAASSVCESDDCASVGASADCNSAIDMDEEPHAASEEKAPAANLLAAPAPAPRPPSPSVQALTLQRLLTDALAGPAAERERLDELELDLSDSASGWLSAV